MSGQLTYANTFAKSPGNCDCGLLDCGMCLMWNMHVYMTTVGAAMACFAIGGWGLLWDDDDGWMMKECWHLHNTGGMVETFPFFYVDAYSAGAFKSK